MQPKGLAEPGKPAPFYHRLEASGWGLKVAGTPRGWRVGEDTLFLSEVTEKGNDLGHRSLWVIIYSNTEFLRKRNSSPKHIVNQRQNQDQELYILIRARLRSSEMPVNSKKIVVTATYVIHYKNSKESIMRCCDVLIFPIRINLETIFGNIFY